LGLRRRCRASPVVTRTVTADRLQNAAPAADTSPAPAAAMALVRCGRDLAPPQAASVLAEAIIDPAPVAEPFPMYAFAWFRGHPDEVITDYMSYLSPAAAESALAILLDALPRAQLFELPYLFRSRAQAWTSLASTCPQRCSAICALDWPTKTPRRGRT